MHIEYHMTDLYPDEQKDVQNFLKHHTQSALYDDSRLGHTHADSPILACRISKTHGQHIKYEIHLKIEDSFHKGEGRDLMELLKTAVHAIDHQRQQTREKHKMHGKKGVDPKAFLDLSDSL